MSASQIANKLSPQDKDLSNLDKIFSENQHKTLWNVSLIEVTLIRLGLVLDDYMTSVSIVLLDKPWQSSTLCMTSHLTRVRVVETNKCLSNPPKSGLQKGVNTVL